MNIAAAFVLGIFIGWLVEWIIDWFYWRRRCQNLEKSSAECARKLEALSREKRELEEKLAGFNEKPETARVTLAEVEPPVPDDLELIKGIGPVIAKLLNEAGVFTFRQLAELTPDKLREVVGNKIQRLADEEDILAQAREYAEKAD